MSSEKVPRKARPWLQRLKAIFDWIFTDNHRRVGMRYLLAVSTFLVMAALVGLLMQFTLGLTGLKIMDVASYGYFVTLHGAIMIFGFAIPSLLATMGNLIVPAMIGAQKSALPRVNSLSFWMYVAGVVSTAIGAIVGRIDVGWTLLGPSAVRTSGVSYMFYGGLALATASMIIVCFSIVLTVHRFRAPGISVLQMSPFPFCIYLTSLLILPLLCERTVVLIALGLRATGQVDWFSSDMLREHLVWFGSSGAVLLTALPVMGVVSEVVSTFGKRKLATSNSFVIASLVYAALSVLAWGNHLMVSGQSTVTSIQFSLISFLLVIPVTMMLTEWSMIIVGSGLTLQTPARIVVGVIVSLVIVIASGVVLSAANLNVYFHGTRFVVGHLHIALLGVVFLGFLAALHYWWPLIFGGMYSFRLSNVGVALLWLGVSVFCVSLMLGGLKGEQVRRSLSSPDTPIGSHLVSLAGALVIALALAIIGWSLWRSRRATTMSANPWSAHSAEFDTNHQWPDCGGVNLGRLSPESSRRTGIL